MAELIFEIGCEEIPARFIRPAEKSVKELLLAEIKKEGISGADHILTYGTPRRIGLTLNGIELVQPDRVVSVMGPKVGIAYDADGNPTKVAIGFAKSQGVNVEDLEMVDGPKGRCIQATKTIVGKKTFDCLTEILPRVIGKIPFPKSMRWSTIEESFARPIHWILAVLDGEIVPFEYANIKSSNLGYGHRFMKPESFVVTTIESLYKNLEEAFVVAECDKRQEIVKKEAERLAESVGGHIFEDDDLIKEVANLVEYPFALLGGFEDEFLKVPKEILIDSMAKNQKYFAILDEENNLLPKFIVFANTKVKDPDVVIAGNERVLRARLADARFFYDEDRQKNLDDLAASLKSVTFEEKLGTIAEKIERIQEHIRYMASFIEPEDLEESLRCATLCKADLQTSVVFEFPSLQGIMGRTYAKLAGESERVCNGIEQHYWPRFADDELPNDNVGAMVALADKMDTVVGCFGVGLKPSGTADPYALRRQALGILRILVDRGYRISLDDWVKFAVDSLKQKLTLPLEDTTREVIEFFEGRYRNWRNADFAQDTIKSVTSANFKVLIDVEERMKALTEFRQQNGFESLAAAFKRVMNILKEKTNEVVDPDLFKSDAENELWSMYQRTRDDVTILVQKREFLSALQAMVGLKANVDRFFDDVLVMDKDEKIRNNRLSLLWHLAELFNQIADFRQIQISE